jgi:hypothetical protein
MEDCLFENMLDDATNVHGTYVRVREILDKHTVGVVMGHFQQQGYTFGEAGDRCGFTREGGSYDPFLEAKLSGVKKVNKRYYLLSFEKELEGVQAGDLVDNLDWYPEVRITNCTIRNNRARGLLFSTHRPITLENNHFSTNMTPILLWTSFSGFWYTSGRVKECIIRGNTFGDCTYGGGNRPLIYAHPGGGFPNAIGESTDEYPMRKLVIEDNQFRSFHPLVLQASGIDTLVFRDNRVELSGNYPPLHEDNPVMDIRGIRLPVVEDNDVPDGIELYGELSQVDYN